MTASSAVVLSNLAYLIGAVVLAIVGGLIVWLFNRKPQSMSANVESFHRSLQALAPSAQRSESGATGGTAQPKGLRIQPRPDDELNDAAFEELALPNGNTAPRLLRPDLPAGAFPPLDDEAESGRGVAGQTGAETG